MNLLAGGGEGIDTGIMAVVTPEPTASISATISPVSAIVRDASLGMPTWWWGVIVLVILVGLLVVAYYIRRAEKKVRV